MKFILRAFSVLGLATGLVGLAFAGDLPPVVDGKITIEGEVTVADAAGAAALEAATAIELTTGSVLTYSADSELALSAQVCGTGTFAATGAGTVTLSGDNSGLVAPGHFAFTNTKVVDSHENGLGGSASGAAAFAKDSALTLEDVTFVMKDGCFTNNAPVTFSMGSVRFGAAAGDKFVQNASLTMSYGGENHFYTSGAFEMISGTMTIKGHPRLHASATAPISIIGTTVCSFNNSCILYGQGVSFGGASVSGGLAPGSDYGVMFVKDDCLGPSCFLAPYPNGYSGIFFNMNGTSQEVARLEQTGNNDTYNSGIHTASDKPATIKAVGAAVCSRTVNLRLNGPLSYWHDTPQNLTFKITKPASTGSLTVSKGSVTFEQGSGWSGREVMVKEAGSLVCNSTASLNSGKHRLVVEAGGSLTVSEDVLLEVGTATFNGRPLEPNTTYTMDDVRDFLGDDPGVAILGSGAIKTGPKSIPGTWTGWPEVGTATKATIPDGTDAVIADADVDKVEALSEIDSGTETTLAIQTTNRELNLRAAVSGALQITAENAAKVILWGDNSGLVYPGAFKFVETPSVISNEFGLGGVRTGEAVFSFANGNAATDIVFGCPHGFFTNNVAVRLVKGREKTSRFGAAKEGDWFVQNADFTVETSGNYHNLYFLYNYRQISGRVRANVGTYLRHDGKGTWGFYGTSDINLSSQCLIYDSGLDVDCAVWTATYGVMPTGNVGTRLMHDNVFSSDTCLRPYANGTGESGMFNFNGTTQEVASLRCSSYNKGNLFSLVSTTPALLKTCSTTLTGSEEMGCVFTGQLSYWHDTTYNITIGLGKSSTRGELIITRGGVGFTAKGGWLGPKITVGGEGRLMITATAQEGLFGTTRKNTPDVYIRENGKIRVDATTFQPVVHNVYIGSRRVDPGTYSAANADWIEGDGSLKVFGTPGFKLLLR